MINVAIITNIPAPYSVDLYKKITEIETNIDLNIVFSAMSRKNRQWTVDKSELKKVYSLDAYIIPRKDGDYIRYIHIPKGTWATLNEIDADILLVYEYSLTSVISMLWARKNKRKFVHVTEGTLWSENNIGFLQKQIRKFVLKYSDFYIACSSKSREKLIKWSVAPDKINTVLLTTDITRYKESRGLKKKNGVIQLLYVGSIEKGKGLDLLIRALKYVDTSSEIILKVVGNGTKANIDFLKDLAAQENISADIIYTGFLEGNKLINEYKNADAFVFPTRSDCYGLVLVEAYCAGIPIVSSKYADGAYDVVESGVNGIIEDPYDAQAFGKAISCVINNDAFKLKALQMNTEKFEIDTEARGFIDVIQNI